MFFIAAINKKIELFYSILYFVEACVHLTEKWAELIICAFINQCTDLDMTSQAALDMLHGICLGMDKLEESTSDRFIERDFIINWDYSNPEPR